MSPNYTVPAGQKDPALLDPATWTEKLPGILNWAIEGFRSYAVFYVSGCRITAYANHFSHDNFPQIVTGLRLMESGA
jgi:hypothetical protein